MSIHDPDPDLCSIYISYIMNISCFCENDFFRFLSKVAYRSLTYQVFIESYIEDYMIPMYHPLPEPVC